MISTNCRDNGCCSNYVSFTQRSTVINSWSVKFNFVPFYLSLGLTCLTTGDQSKTEFHNVKNCGQNKSLNTNNTPCHILPHDQRHHSRHHDWHHFRPHYRNQDWTHSRQHVWPKLWCQRTFIWIFQSITCVTLSSFPILQNIARAAKKYIELDIMKLWSQLEERNSGSPLTRSSTLVRFPKPV